MGTGVTRAARRVAVMPDGRTMDPRPVCDQRIPPDDSHTEPQRVRTTPRQLTEAVAARQDDARDNRATPIRPDFLIVAREQGWDTCVIATPSALKFMDLDKIAEAAGRPLSLRVQAAGRTRRFSPTGRHSR